MKGLLKINDSLVRAKVLRLLPKDMVVGDTFTLGKYQVENETPWAIEWEIVHQTSDYQIAMTK